MLRRSIRKETIMSPIDLAAIERQARQLRAEEMQRIRGLVSARLNLYGQLLGATARSGLAAVGKTVRPLFSWNPQTRHPS